LSRKRKHSGSKNSNVSGILSQLKVLEVASVLAGPAVGMFFSERGAQVVKIENSKSGGDVTRSWKLEEEDSDINISAYFCSVNWNKEYLFMDLNNPTERPELEALIKEADILIANFKFGDAEKFKLEFNNVKKLNPQIIHAELSGFGSHDHRVAYDLVLQAETGFMFMNGTPQSGPVKIPLAIIDILAAHQLKEGILEALLMRENKSQAYHVEASLYDAAIASLANQGSNYLMANHIPQAIGSLHPNIAPYGEIFRTKDHALITLAIGSDSQFIKLLEILDIKVSDRFSSNKKRIEFRTEIENILTEKIHEWNTADLCKELIDCNVPVARINNLEEVFQDSKAKGLILNEEIEGVKTRRVKTAVYTITSA
jgi:crotonobetainyl-CoA:carnitine CoA-transferase CaiB-like acyl-CoA transferase